MTKKADVIQNYILAKDGNRPFILNSAFANDATLHMDVRTESIAFPELLSGRDAIANTLVREFNQKYENIYTICIGRRPQIDKSDFTCQWLVAMTEKLNGSLRFGCGSYDWTFGTGDVRARSLTIKIDTMETTSSESVAEVLNWVSDLTYPWCELSEVAKKPPNNSAVVRVVRLLEETAVKALMVGQ